MGHIHPVTDSDKCFTIDPLTRTVSNGSKKVILMKLDHNSERLTFAMPRYIEGHDMALSDKVQIHYINVGSNREKSCGVYNVEDFKTINSGVLTYASTPKLDSNGVLVVPEQESDASMDDMVTGTWLISANATKYAGTLNFIVRFECNTGDVIDYAWNSGIYSGIIVSDGIYNSETVVEQYADILESWREDIFSALGDCFATTEEVQNIFANEVSQ